MDESHGTAESLGKTLRALREEHGWSQEEVAERIGGSMTQADVSNLERGRVTLPRRPRMERLAAVYGVPLGELLARSGWPSADAAFPNEPLVDYPEVEALVATLREIAPVLGARDLRLLRRALSAYEDDLTPLPAPDHQPVGVSK